MTFVQRALCLFVALLPVVGAAQLRMPVDSLQQLVERADARALAVVRHAPDSARTVLTRLLAAAATAPRAELAAGQVAAARQLADAYAIAWRDSFYVRQVAQFERWSRSIRIAKASVDSLRGRGATELGALGAATAMRTWRESYRLAHAIGDTWGQAMALGNIGVALYREGELDSANMYLERGRALAERIGDRRTAVNARGTLGAVAHARGDEDAAKAHYAHALGMREQIGDDRGAASDENNLGLLAQAIGDTAGARRFFGRALARNRAAGRISISSDNLVNLANLDVLGGRYEVAEHGYREALAIRTAAGERVREAAVLHNLGLLALRRNDLPGARQLLVDALRIFDATGPLDDAIAARMALAQVEGLVGDIDGALETLNEADALAARARRDDLAAAAALARADLAMDFNALRDATREYQRAESLFVAMGDELSAADARQGQGIALLRHGEATRARQVLEGVLVSRRAAGDRHAVAQARLLFGVACTATADTATARRELRLAHRELLQLGDAVGVASVLGALADLEVATGAFRGALTLYDRALAALPDRAASMVTLELRRGKATAFDALGMRADAARELRAAIALVERQAGAIRGPSMRTTYRADSWDMYERLALYEQAVGNHHAAFAMSERLRSRQMLELLSRGRIASSYSAPALLEDSSLVTSFDIQAVMTRLAPDDALIEFLVTDSVTVVFLLRQELVTSIRIPIARRALASSVEFTRDMIGGSAVNAGTDGWRPPLERLHRLLIAPLEQRGHLRGVRRLLIVPHAELHYLPFAALVDERDRSFLVERYAIAYAPSASVWLQLVQRTRRHATTSVLSMAPHTTRLPASGNEARAVVDVFGSRATVLTGRKATKGAFHARAGAASIIHLATFGVLNRHNPLYSFVELARDAHDDGRLAVHEVLSASLNARLVVLSACETGLGAGTVSDVPAGDEWVGLVRAFLHAGADNVVATLWPVVDRQAATLVRDFYGALDHGSLADALAQAQRRAIQTSSSSNPIHWAAFTLAGTTH